MLSPLEKQPLSINISPFMTRNKSDSDRKWAIMELSSLWCLTLFCLWILKLVDCFLGCVAP